MEHEYFLETTDYIDELISTINGRVVELITLEGRIARKVRLKDAKTVWNNIHCCPGVYLFRLYSNGKLVQKGRIRI